MLHCEGRITALGDSLCIIALEETPNTLSHHTIPQGGVGEISLDANPHRMTKQLVLIHQYCVLSIPATNILALSFMCKKHFSCLELKHCRMTHTYTEVT